MAVAGVVARRVMRAAREVVYVNTLNFADRVTIDFVWYPGETVTNVQNSWVDTLVAAPGADGNERTIDYTWALTGRAPVRRTMEVGRITVALPPGSTGTLTVFGTSWQITRAAAGQALDPAGTVRGIQQRLNALGYHLRAPGQAAAGADGVAGRLTECAILAFQADYRPQAGAPAAAASRLNIRGEFMNNPSIANNLNWYNNIGGGPAGFNPSGADSASVGASLVASVGA
jgi:hypothetical protein